MGLEERNFFSDRAIQDDPYPYFAALRELSPVWREPHHGVFMVTGYDEARAVYADTADFSSCNVVSGPFKRFPVPLEGEDVSDIIEQYRDDLPFSDQLPSFDPPKHSAHRGLLTKLLTPRRMRENEEFMWRLADSQLAEVIAAGESEFIHGFAEPFTLSVVAELEGVPEADHGLFRQRLSAPPTQLEQKPLEFLYAQFSTYIEDRRSAPREDIMSAMATAKFPDGSTPQVHDVALLAANLFAGGQETTVRLLSFALRLIAERPDLQALLRNDRERIPGFIEETLRYESPLRSQFRMARRRVTVAGVDIPAGSNLLLLPGAANRDPSAFPDPDRFDPERKDARNHVTFGHGAHLCLGAHLARAEGRVTLNRLLDLTTDIRISEKVHGPQTQRRYDYLPTFFLRGLRSLTVEYVT
jgi:cytochrome P450 family 150 subfamily A5